MIPNENYFPAHTHVLLVFHPLHKLTALIHSQAHFKIHTTASVIPSIRRSSSHSPSTLSFTADSQSSKQFDWQNLRPGLVELDHQSVVQLNISGSKEEHLVSCRRVSTTKTPLQIHCPCWALSGAPAPRHPTTENTKSKSECMLQKWLESSGQSCRHKGFSSIKVPLQLNV